MRDTAFEHRHRALAVGVAIAACVVVFPARARGDINSSPNLPQAQNVSRTAGVFETTIVAKEVSVAVPGLGTVKNAITFNGSIPGPEIRVKVGDTVIVHYQSQLPASEGNTSIHWHGVELANSSDGTAVTQDPVPPGGSYTYIFKVPRPGIFWYHPHMSPTNPVFRGQYGSLIVTGPDDQKLQSLGVLPPASQTKTLVLADTTVCKTPGSNDASTFPASASSAPSNFPPWAGDVNGDGLRDPFPGRDVGPSPSDLCDARLGPPFRAALAAGTIPNVQYDPDACPNNDTTLIDLSSPCTISEGQNVLVNGSVPAPRNNPPDALPLFSNVQAPGPVTATTGVLNVTPGEGVRLQMINAALARYFRLQLEDAHGSVLQMFRVGGEGGLLNNARLEGGLNPDPKYLHFQGMNSAGPNQFSGGEILLAPGQRSDVVLRIPPSAAPGDVLTIWTRDFQRGMGSDGANPLEHPPAGPCSAGVGHCGPNGYSLLPTVPVLHMRVVAGTSQPSTIANGTPLLTNARVNHPLEDLSTAQVTPLTTPAAAGQTVGSSNATIDLNMGRPATLKQVGYPNERPMIDSTIGMLDNNTVPGRDFSQVPRPANTRYARVGDVLELTVDNLTGMNHPFHLHGFSFQPIRLQMSPGCVFKSPPPLIRAFDYPELLDTFDVPACSRLVFRVRLDDRPIVRRIGTTLVSSPGGAIGRWVFHCHIFEHATDGMMGELDVLPPAGPSFFALRAKRTKDGATITAKLRKPRLLGVKVVRIAGRRRVTVGVARLGRHRAGRSSFHWNLRVNRHLLAPGTYHVTLHGISEGTLLSAPAAPGPIKLIIGRDGRIRVRAVPPGRRAAAVQFTHGPTYEYDPFYCRFATPSLLS